MDLKTTPDSVEWLGATYHFKLRASETGGSIGIFETTDKPGFGPPRHIHQNEDETFLVQSGDVEFWLEGETMTCAAGDTVFIPRGKEHTFRVIGERPARMITIMTPGGFEGFFSEMATRGLQIPQDMDEVVEIGARFNLVFTGPPLGAE